MLTVLFMNCRGRIEKHLYSQQDKSDNILSINYEGDHIGGFSINAKMTSNKITYDYFFNIVEYEGNRDSGWYESGTIRNLGKIESKFQDSPRTNLDAERSLQLLVSDTTERFQDSTRNPNLFGEPVNGFSDTFVVNNIINRPNSLIKILKITEDEKHLLTVIDSVMKKNKIDYKNIDTSKVLGWFQYVF